MILAFSRAFIPDVPSLSKSSYYTGTGTENLKLTFKCYLNLRRIQQPVPTGSLGSQPRLSPAPTGFSRKFSRFASASNYLKAWN